jgi:hypothetical protein
MRKQSEWWVSGRYHRRRDKCTEFREAQTKYAVMLAVILVLVVGTICPEAQSSLFV